MGRAARELKLGGVYASAITPHMADILEPDYSAALDLLDFLAGAGVDGICLLGTAGEFLNYSFDERHRLVYLGSKRSRVPLLVGVSHSTLAGAVQLAGEAVAAGADGLLLMPPYFYRYSQCEIEEFYREFAREATDVVPVLLHHAPQFTSGLEIATIRRLIAGGGFAGIKDSSGDWCRMAELLELKREFPFALFCGSDRLAARALSEGADGVISDCACAMPEFAPGDPRAIEFLDWIEKLPPLTAVKRALELQGQKAGAPLTPLAPETARLLEEFDLWFKRVKHR